MIQQRDEDHENKDRRRQTDKETSWNYGRAVKKLNYMKVMTIIAKNGMHEVFGNEKIKQQKIKPWMSDREEKHRPPSKSVINLF